MSLSFVLAAQQFQPIESQRQSRALCWAPCAVLGDMVNSVAFIACRVDAGLRMRSVGSRSKGIIATHVCVRFVSGFDYQSDVRVGAFRETIPESSKQF